MGAADESPRSSTVGVVEADSVSVLDLLSATEPPGVHAADESMTPINGGIERSQMDLPLDILPLYTGTPAVVPHASWPQIAPEDRQSPG
jgi:hypothetical protein